MCTFNISFDFLAPNARPNDDNNGDDEIGPCGLRALAGRTDFPIGISQVIKINFLVGGIVSIKGYHKESTVTVRLSLKEQVIANSDFTNELAKKYLPKAAAWSSDPLDLSKIPGVRNGVKATIQVSTDDGHSAFNCADVILVGKETPVNPPKPDITATKPTVSSASNSGVQASTTATGTISFSAATLTTVTNVVPTNIQTASGSAAFPHMINALIAFAL